MTKQEKILVWDAMRTPPQDALKKIDYGTLKGKYDISPQWRYKIMTETFGACGVGWKFEHVSDTIIDTPNDTKGLFVQINLYVKTKTGWSDPIPGWGGDVVIGKNKHGLYFNDEAFKMATTDALGTAMKMLGVAADVYEGKMDNSKYSRPTQPQPAPAPTPAQSQPQQLASPGEHDTIRSMIGTISKNADHTQSIMAYLEQVTGKANNRWTSKDIDLAMKLLREQGAK